MVGNGVAYWDRHKPFKCLSFRITSVMRNPLLVGTADSSRPAGGWHRL